MRRFLTVLAMGAFLMSAGFVSAADKAPAKDKDAAAAPASDTAPAKGKGHKHHGHKGTKKPKEEAAPATK